LSCHRIGEDYAKEIDSGPHRVFNEVFKYDQ